MKILFFTTNYFCDIYCNYCFYTINYIRRFKEHLGGNQSAFVAAKISALDFQTVILTGGDPLQSGSKTHTYALIKELKKSGRKVIINTSGVSLDGKDVDQLISTNVDKIDISIDSCREEIHNAQRGRFQETVKTIKAFLDRGYGQITATVTITEASAPTLVETILWLRTLGVKEVRIQPVFAFQQKNPDAIMSAMENAREYLASPHVSDYVELARRLSKGNAPLPNANCRMGKDVFVCSPTGILTPCFHRPDIVLGNIFSDPTEKIKEAMLNSSTEQQKLPLCIGQYCVSLFNNPRFWEEDNAI